MSSPRVPSAAESATRTLPCSGSLQSCRLPRSGPGPSRCSARCSVARALPARIDSRAPPSLAAASAWSAATSGLGSSASTRSRPCSAMWAAAAAGDAATAVALRRG
eukprot:4812000-Prymnesium_polylepis.1